MKWIIILFAAISSFSFINSDKNITIQSSVSKDSIPAFLLGEFKDDYGIEYSLSDSLFTQFPNVKYHILRWNIREKYFIAKNDEANPSEQGLYSRIDYMEFTGMEPFKWGFCLTEYKAASDVLAEAAIAADREHPKKGCGGFPFSRMKRK